MPEAGAVNSGSAGAVNVSPRLEKAITELRGLQELLLSGDGLDSRILTDFREALNRIRNTAWSAQQYIALKATDQDSGSVLTILAGERVRAAYQLCQAIQIERCCRQARVNRLPICIRTSQDYRTRLFVPALLRAFSRAQDCFRYD